MICARCGVQNREGAAFCRGCGARFALACSSCGAELPPDSQFCDACGACVAQWVKAPAPERAPRDYTPRHLAEKILQSKSVLEGERKQVTVLFADVKGSMELAEQVDPEEWHRILDRFFQILTDGVHRFEGTVNQYTGDGIMALFGAPIAHEEHAQRACYAALHLRDALRGYADELRLDRGISFAVRMGLNSGDVIVGKIGDDLRMDYTAQGQTVGLAARMEQLAAPDHAYLTEHTAKLAAGFFELRDLGASKVKGLAEPLHVYELEGVGGARTRLDVSRARGFSKFVGRQDEMARLESALGRAIEGKGQVVGVVAEAGIGKSRLCFEFTQHCRARGITVSQAHCVAHGKAIPLLPVLELMRGVFGITERESDQGAREKIAGRLLLLDKAFDDALPLVFDLLGVPDPERPVLRGMDPEARQRQLFAVVKRMVHARSRREPAVTLIEDLHWIDGGTEGFLEQLVEAVPGTRTLLLVDFRPEYHAGWMQKSYYQQLPLLPLGTEEIEELLSDLLGPDPSLAGLAGRIRERTAGNPFFIEEVVQSLIESGNLEGSRGSYRLVTPVEKLEVPGTVQAVLAARIDRLGEREKQVLQTAAVIGRELPEPVLQRVVDLADGELAAALHALTAAEFIYEQALYPEAEYAFKHPLTQEVAYQSQLGERRARVHAAVGRTIAELYPEKLDERAALLAHHWEGAGDRLEAARWHQRAAAWVGTSDFTAALRHCRQVRELLKTVPESAETLEMEVAACSQMLNLVWRLGTSADEAATLFAEGKELAIRTGDLRSLVMLTTYYGAIQGLGGGGTLEDYIELSKEAMRLAERTDDAGLKLALQINLTTSHGFAGRFGDALAFAEEALAGEPEDLGVGSEITGYLPSIFFHCFRGYLLSHMGRLDEGAQGQDRAVALGREHGDLENLGWAHTCHVFRAHYAGDDQVALGHARHAVECAEKIGSPLSCVFAYQGLGVAHLLHEQWGEAVAALERALALARESRAFLSQQGEILADLAMAHLGSGEPEKARAAAEEALAAARRHRTRGWECEAHLALARVLLRTEGAQARAPIEAALRQAVELAAETGFKSIEPLIREGLAELAGLLGDEETRQRELREAHRLFTEMGATGHAARLAKSAGS